MTSPHDDEATRTNGVSRGTNQEQLEKAQLIAREMLSEDHRAVQVSVRNSRD
jgi:hypothetical protein